ncbi:MAG: LysR family transcriptional regulator [Lawsonibacter sp.]|nr:LysR family transcriptional regulator [Lawsonibacter sp.]
MQASAQKPGQQRPRYGIQLTPEGERLFPFIQRTIAQYQSMQEIAREIKGLDTGTIRIGTISSVSCHWLPRLRSTLPLSIRRQSAALKPSR